MHSGAIAMALNSKIRSTLWESIKTHWDELNKKLSASSVTLDRFLKQTLTKFADRNVASEIDTFFKDKDTKAIDKGLAQAKDTINANAAYKEREEKLILEWLQAKGYA